MENFWDSPVENGFADSFMPDVNGGISEDQNREIDGVGKVMEDVLSGQESPDVLNDDFSEENPYYDHFAKNFTEPDCLNPSIENCDSPVSLDENQVEIENSASEFVDVPNAEELSLAPENLSEVSKINKKAERNPHEVGEASLGRENMSEVSKINEKAERNPQEVGDQTISESPMISEASNLPENQNATKAKVLAKPNPSVAPQATQKLAFSEPENMIRWRKERAIMLEERDTAEAEKKKEWSELGKTQLEIWEKNYRDVIEKTKMENRKSNEAFFNVNSTEKHKIGFTNSSTRNLNSMEEEGEVTVWEYVAKLCDLSPNNRNIKSDVSRMRLLMLQLKNEKFTGPKTVTKL